jgi:hypothetical protein
VLIKLDIMLSNYHLAIFIQSKLSAMNVVYLAEEVRERRFDSFRVNLNVN